MASNNAGVDGGNLGTKKTAETPHIRFPSCRLILTVLSFLGFFVVYCLRVNLSVALVAMVNATYIKELEASDSVSDGNSTEDRGLVEELCEAASYNVTHTDSGDYNWDAKKQGVILAAFFYGYIITQIPGGMLAQRFGGKFLLLFGIFWTSVLTLLTPVITYAGDFAAIVATRILEGIGEGVTYPAMHVMISKWSPPLERSKMVTFVYAGAQIGTVITMPISGLLCEYVNWESVFYVFGAIGVLWSVFWFFFVFDSPAKHPRISPQERSYIEASQGTQTKGSLSVPWLQIAKSPPVYAVAVAHFTNNWGYYTLLTCLPQYLKHILKFDIKSNGFVSGIPYLVLWGIMILTGFSADYIRKRQFMSTTMVRKVFNAVGFIGPAACLVATGYVDCNAPLAVALIVMSVGLSGISWGGWSVNHLDLAPPYAGTLMGITNAIATIPGFVGPSVVGALTYKNQTRQAWRGVFYISAAVYIFGTIFYFIFGSGERQKWASDPMEAKVEALKDVEDNLLPDGANEIKKSDTKMVMLENGSMQDVSSALNNSA